MTVRIVDRRFDSKNKSSVNRSRFIRRFKGQIRKAVSEALNHRGVRDLENGEKVGIPGKDIAEPHFAHGPGGVREVVDPGNDRFSSGDQVERPQGGGSGQGGSQASNEGESLDDFVFTLTRDEFLDIFFEELALPNLVKNQLARIEQFKRVRAGYTQSGVPTNINLARTMRGAAGRRIAIGGPYAGQLRALEAELAEMRKTLPEDDPEITRVRREIAQAEGQDRGAAVHRPVRLALQRAHSHPAADGASGDVLPARCVRFDGRRSQERRQTLLHAALPLPDAELRAH